jgi:3-hydroxyisobutyrate dehydrogenase
MDFEKARFNMVEQQIRPWDVLNTQLLDLLFHVKRENFVADNQKAIAFVDTELPLPNGSRMLQPKMEARILQELNIAADEKILEIGTGSGYLTALLASVGKHVYSLEAARPLLEAMGKNIFHAGAAGAGQTAKICNNMLLGILMAGTAEALALGVANGLDPKVLSDIMSKSSGRNWALEVYNPWPGVMENAPASRGYSGGFGSDLMLKDLGLAQEAALHARAATPLGAAARNLYQLHSQNGQGGLDFSSIVQMMSAKAKPAQG